MCVLFVQRLLLRIAPKYSKGYTDVTKHAPKVLLQSYAAYALVSYMIDWFLVLESKRRHTQKTYADYEYILRACIITE